MNEKTLKKVAYINAWGNGSTGTIVNELRTACEKEGVQTLSLYGRAQSRMAENSVNVNSKINLYSDALLSRLFDNHGCNSQLATRKLIKHLKTFSPDIVHLHNLHGYWVNYPMLFKFLNKQNIPVVWTFHDAWPITGHCACYHYINCQKQKIGCGNCPAKAVYPKSLVDNSAENYKKKMSIFASPEKMHVITPSEWLANIVRQTPIGKKHPVSVIHNEINKTVFRPTEYEYLYEKYGIPRNKKTVLYVAMSTSDPWKGFDILMDAAALLPEEYCMIIVGDCSEVSTDRTVVVGRTENQQDMAAFYSMADVLANPSLDDNYPTINIEALACGLPIVSFYTGGIPEQVDEEVGILCEEKTGKTLACGIEYVCNMTKAHYRDKCIARYNSLCYERGYQDKYIDIYKSVI